MQPQKALVGVFGWQIASTWTCPLALDPPDGPPA
jgi:hypothetical protein